MKTYKHVALAAAFTLAAPAVWAHPGHPGHGFDQGLAHPFGGLDHMLAMIAVGLWAAQIGGRARWGLPAAFLGFMLVGGALGVAGVPMPAVESGIAASVLVLGLLVATAARVPVGSGSILVALFAVLHGHAHGTELAGAASAWTYAAGFTIATALLHACGLGAGSALARRAGMGGLVRLSGGAIAAAGLLMSLGAF